MEIPLKSRLYIISGLIGIIIVYSVYQLNFVDVTNYYHVPRLLRQLSRGFTVLFVYAIGTLALQAVCHSWVVKLWHLLNLVGMALLVIVGLSMYVSNHVSYMVINIGYSVTEFLISPIFYVVCIILNFRLAGLVNKNDN